MSDMGGVNHVSRGKIRKHFGKKKRVPNSPLGEVYFTGSPSYPSVAPVPLESVENHNVIYGTAGIVKMTNKLVQIIFIEG